MVWLGDGRGPAGIRARSGQEMGEVRPGDGRGLAGRWARSGRDAICKQPGCPPQTHGISFEASYFPRPGGPGHMHTMHATGLATSEEGIAIQASLTA